MKIVLKISFLKKAHSVTRSLRIRVKINSVYCRTLTGGPSASSAQMYYGVYGQPQKNMSKRVEVMQNLGAKPAVTTCFNCHQTVTTVVDSKIKDGGWLWCLVCTLFFSVCVGLLAACLDGFK